MAATVETPLVMRKRLTRDQQIVICYRAGNSQQKIAETFQLTRGRVQQILKKAGCTKLDNPNTPRGQLYAFIGVNVTKDIKAAFIKEAKRQKLSLSALCAKLIKQELER